MQCPRKLGGLQDHADEAEPDQRDAERPVRLRGVEGLHAELAGELGHVEAGEHVHDVVGLPHAKAEILFVGLELQRAAAVVVLVELRVVAVLHHRHGELVAEGARRMSEEHLRIVRRADIALAA